MCMTVLQTDSAALAGMTENLWLEKACSNLIPALPLWIIEYAWSKRMMEVLEVLGPPLWLEGDWHVLTFEEPCRIRVVAAEVWRIVQARDIKHFERAIKFLDVTYMLKPKLVTPIKHMKILFGLKTLVIMWMLWNDQATAKISDKIEKLFPNSLPQYYKCNRRHMELMQKNGEDFKSFAHALAENRNMRKTYIRDLMEKQYGERYAQKLEERLSHYLGELDKALSQPTFIEQVLKQSYPQGRGEKILRKLLSEDTSLATNLKRLLHCAVTLQLSPDDSITPSLNLNTYEEQREGVKSSQETLHVIVRPSQGQTQEDRLSQMRSKEICTSQCLWQNRGKGCTFPQESSEEICGDEALMTSIQMSSLLGPKINQIDCNPSMLEDQGEPIESSQQLGQERTGSERSDLEHTCSKHGKKMKSILRECSEEFDVENVQAECTPPSPQISPLLLSDTPQSDASQDTQNSASPHQHSLTTNTSVSTHQDSSSTNISMSYNQQITLSPLSTDQHPISTSITSPTGSAQLISTSSPSSLLQCSSSSTSTTSKQNNTPRINARHITDSTRQFLAAVVFTKRSEVTSRASGHELTLSLESQTFLMQCKWLQPQVRLHRLSREECFRSTDSCRTNLTSDEEQESEDEEYIPFDVNTLYSDTNSESTDSDDSDYIPNRD